MCINNSKSIIFIGILIDKPLHLLLNYNRKFNQKIYSLNETFTFPPKKGFDYNVLDKYYSLNSFDEQTQNIFSGEIKNFKRVNFYRKNLSNIQLSEEFIKIRSRYKNMILVIPCQIYGNRYSAYSVKDLYFFIDNIIKISKIYNNTLFVIKEKKSELRLLQNLVNIAKLQKNIHIIRCENPKELVNNNFDSLLTKANLLISIAYNSTTIWQSIISNCPFLIFNENIPETFLNKYNLINNDLSSLQSSIDFWLNISDENFNSFQSKIFKETNINVSSDGILQIIEDILNDLSSTYKID